MSKQTKPNTTGTEMMNAVQYYLENPKEDGGIFVHKPGEWISAIWQSYDGIENKGGVSFVVLTVVREDLQIPQRASIATFNTALVSKLAKIAGKITNPADIGIRMRWLFGINKGRVILKDAVELT